MNLRSELVLVVAGKFFGAGIALLSIYVLTSVFGPAEYGTLTLLLGFYSLASLVFLSPS